MFAVVTAEMEQRVRVTLSITLARPSKCKFNEAEKIPRFLLSESRSYTRQRFVIRLFYLDFFY